MHSLLRVYLFVTGCVVVFKRLQQNPNTIKILYETSTQYTLSPDIIYFLFYSVVIICDFIFPDNSRGGDLSSRRYCSVIDCAAIIVYSMVGDISWMYFCIWLKKQIVGKVRVTHCVFRLGHRVLRSGRK